MFVLHNQYEHVFWCCETAPCVLIGRKMSRGITGQETALQWKPKVGKATSQFDIGNEVPVVGWKGRAPPPPPPPPAPPKPRGPKPPNVSLPAAASSWWCVRRASGRRGGCCVDGAQQWRRVSDVLRRLACDAPLLRHA